MSLLILPFAFLAMWLLIIRPQQRKQKAQMEVVTQASIGDEIITAGGFVGTIMDVHDPQDSANGLGPDEVLLALSDAVEVVFRRRSIAEIRESWDGQFDDGTYLDEGPVDNPIGDLAIDSIDDAEIVVESADKPDES